MLVDRDAEWAMTHAGDRNVENGHALYTLYVIPPWPHQLVSPFLPKELHLNVIC